MRELALLNEITSSTHATVAVTGLAGFDAQKGFEEQTRDQAVREVAKAIDFAGDATTGGAIVVHTGEWNRPIYDSHSTDYAGDEKYNFTGYEGEDVKGVITVVDARTGQLNGMKKDQPVFEPIFTTIENYEKEKGVKLVGTHDKNGNVYEAEDWVGTGGELIKREWEFNPDKSIEMFKRVPEWDSKGTNFKTEHRDWNYFKKKRDWWNERNPDQQLTPEEIFAKTQYMNQVIQAKGGSLYHAKYYEREKESRDAFVKTLEFYEKLEDSLSEEEKRKLTIESGYFNVDDRGLLPRKSGKIVDFLKEKIKQQEDVMRYTHEASAASDVQATTFHEAMKNVQTLEQYGLKKSGETLAELGIKAMHKYEANKDQLKEKLYIAPENWHPNQYGSHPDELIAIVKEGRKKMADRLAPSMGREKAEALAQDHIKSTFDTGHLNMWKAHLIRKTDEHGIPIETDEQFNKRFADWALEKVKKMDKEKVLAHIHLTDNFGYDDEHINIGKGNTPIKEIMTFLKDKGYDDFTVEQGSFNNNVMPEAWSYFGSPVYSISPTGGGGGRFSQVHKQHFGYDAPPLYIVGAYAPTNEWKVWSEVPLE